MTLPEGAALIWPTETPRSVCCRPDQAHRAGIRQYQKSYTVTTGTRNASEHISS
ncbi:hypothetical protein AF41_03352 [Citrobacter sp. MGH 55]|nr:hypothetical protein AF41_03352 [Citrobacter sp. MGH 55]